MPPLDQAATSDRFAVSVSALTNNCISMFRTLKHLLVEETTETVENRLADFRLWADGVGAMAKPGASLDSRFHSRPDDLALVKGILIMLTDFLDECMHLARQRQSISEAITNVDSSIMNLAMIGMAIRRTGRASRSRRADQSFRPDDHQELRKHLECIVLLRPSETQPALSVPENQDDLPSESQKAFSARLDALEPSKLSILQRRLIEANLRRRHRFLLAQKRSQRTTQVGPQDKILDAWNIADDHSALETPKSNLSSTATQTDMTPHATSLPNHLLGGRPSSIAVLSTASTAEGTLQYRPAQRYTPAIAPSQISFIAADTEFPNPPAHSRTQLVVKCPCCCQSLPTQIFESPIEWKKHLVEDLCPYTCITEHCPTPQLLFASRKAWETHVERDHPIQWRCALCEEEPTVFRLVRHIEDHISIHHPDEISSYSLSTLVSWSEVQRMGVRSCPLCPSYGPGDSPELIDHVVRHSYEFALRSLPWPDSPQENLNRPIGTYTLPDHEEKANWLETWIEDADHDIKSSSLHLSAFDLVMHDTPGEQQSESDRQDYFADNAYFDVQDIAGSSRQQSQLLSERSSLDSSTSLPDSPFIQNVDAYVKASPVLAFFFSNGNKDFIQNICRKAADLAQDDTTDLGSPDVMPKTTQVTLFQQVILCDNTFSTIDVTGWRNQLKLALRIARITTRILPEGRGVALRFIHQDVEDTSFNLRVETLGDIAMSEIRRGHKWKESKIGTCLRSKLLQPMVYDRLTSYGIDRPLLVSILIRCAPRIEPSDTLTRVIIECGDVLENSGYPRGTVKFVICQAGDDPVATNFLETLRRDGDIAQVAFVVPDKLDDKLREFEDSDRALDRWLIETLYTPIMFGQREEIKGSVWQQYDDSLTEFPEYFLK